MNKLYSGKLIYKKDIKNAPAEITTLENIKIRVGNVSASKFYAYQNNDIQVSNVCFVSDEYFKIPNIGRLDKVEYGDSIYKVLKITLISGHRIMLDLESEL